MTGAVLDGFMSSLRVATQAADVSDEAQRQARFIAMRRGLRYLLDYATIHVRSGITTSEALRFAHQITRPDLLRNPRLGVKEMARLGDLAKGTQLEPLYAFASDAFTRGVNGRGNGLEDYLMDTPASHVRSVRAQLQKLPATKKTREVLADCERQLSALLWLLDASVDAPGEEAAVA